MRWSDLHKALDNVASTFSAEWLLTKWGWPNGGNVILVRTLIITFVIYATGVLTRYWLGTLVDDVAWSSHDLAKSFVDKGKYVYLMSAGVYAALYTRFASQWAYLAGVYNRIKETEARTPTCDAMAQWKAGFIDDAMVLHLAGKASFAMTVRSWANDPAVRRAYLQANPRTGEEALRELFDRLARQYGCGMSGVNGASTESTTSATAAVSGDDAKPPP